MPDIITLRRFDDMHCHLRTEQMLRDVLHHTARYCGRALAMPNTLPPVLSGDDAKKYRSAIEYEHGLIPQRFPFEPLMSVKLRDDTTPAMITSAKESGVVAAKVYPKGVTTNASDGLSDFFGDQITAVFEEMQQLGMILLLHGECDEERVLVTKREHRFLRIFNYLAERFSGLKIVLEHVSTADGVELVKSLGSNVAATITAHHLCMTLNDVIGDGIRPHNGCMPMPKDFHDRDALNEAAISGNPKFFLGSDSAPHTQEKKECAKGACGVFTAPILPSLLVEIFEAHGKLGMLNDFTSRFGAEFYGLPLNQGEITLVREEWKVPAKYDLVVPFKAGETLQWKLV